MYIEYRCHISTPTAIKIKSFRKDYIDIYIELD